MNSSIYLMRCQSCGNTTSKAYGRKHHNRCKQCVQLDMATTPTLPSRNERILESGYMAYAIEEGHYGNSDY